MAQKHLFLGSMLLIIKMSCANIREIHESLGWAFAVFDGLDDIGYTGLVKA